jgi:hypothetical protein
MQQQKPSGDGVASAHVLYACAVALFIAGATGCHAYRPVSGPVNQVVPVHVRLPAPMPVTLRREHPDPVIPSVSRLEGTLLLLETDSMRIDVTRAESNGRWRDVAAPAEASIPMRPGTRVERRVISRSRTLLLIGAAWAAATVAVLASIR